MSFISSACCLVALVFHIRRNAFVVRSGGLFRPLCCPTSKVGGAFTGGWPCRPPAAGASAAPGGTPLRGLSLRSAQWCPLRGVFFRLARCVAAACLQGFPLVGSPSRFAPCSHAPSARQLCDIVCLARGARCSDDVLGASPLRLLRGRYSASPAPLRGRTSAPIFWGALIGDPPDPPA